MGDPLELCEFIAEQNPTAARLEPASFYDRFIVGAAYRFNVGPLLAYDMKGIIRAHVEEDEMTYEEATEYFQFNTLGAWVGEGTPIFVDSDPLTDFEVSDDHSRT